MQGIQLFHYKSLLGQLNKLQHDEIINMPCEHTELIIQYEEKLKCIYINYKDAFENVSAIIRQFEEHKKAIVRLKACHRQCRKNF